MIWARVSDQGTGSSVSMSRRIGRSASPSSQTSAAAVDIGPGRVDGIERGGEDGVARERRVELGDVEALAAGDADEVGEDDVDRIDQRVVGEEGRQPLIQGLQPSAAAGAP
jgi:DNA-binding transcriptional regulator YdaS (Cro superfamily)